MQSISILDIKQFMQFLFQSEELSSYDFVSADVKTDITYTLDGHLNRCFYSKEELEEAQLSEQRYLPWLLGREKVFHLIKGKKTPSLLKVVLKASTKQLETFLKDTNSSLTVKDIDGMYLNIHYQENQLNVICGISYNIFTLDKEFESEFSRKIVTLFKSKKITCEHINI